MRVYVYQPGDPSCISAVVAVSEREWREMTEHGVPRQELSVLPESDGEVFTRDELLEVSTRRRALKAWESEDDSTFEARWEQDRYSYQENLVKERFLEGCPEAARLLVEGLNPDEVDRFENFHSCGSHAV